MKRTIGTPSTASYPQHIDPLLTIDGELLTGIIVDRPNRFVIRVRFEDAPERVFLEDPGALESTVGPRNEILCLPVDDSEHATDYDVITVHVDGVYVSVRPALTNDLFERVLAYDTTPAFAGYSHLKCEPALPEHGRTDFLAEIPADEAAFVGIESYIHVEDNVAMSPDCQTERGRRYPWSLEALLEGGHETHVVLVVQRPDVECFRPY